MNEGNGEGPEASGSFSKFRLRRRRNHVVQQEIPQTHHETALTEQTNPFTRMGAMYASLLTSPELLDKDKIIIERMKKLIGNERKNLFKRKQDLLPMGVKMIPVSILRDVLGNPDRIEPISDPEGFAKQALFPSKKLKELILRSLGSLGEDEPLEAIYFLPKDTHDMRERGATVSVNYLTGRQVTLPTNIPDCRVEVNVLPTNNNIDLLLDPTLVDRILAQDD